MLCVAHGDKMINADGSGSGATSFSATQTEFKVFSAIAWSNDWWYLTRNGIEIWDPKLPNHLIILEWQFGVKYNLFNCIWHQTVCFFWHVSTIKIKCSQWGELRRETFPTLLCLLFLRILFFRYTESKLTPIGSKRLQCLWLFPWGSPSLYILFPCTRKHEVLFYLIHKSPFYSSSRFFTGSAILNIFFTIAFTVPPQS